MPQKDQPTLLLIENSPDICTLISLSLSSIPNLQIQTVSTGKEGMTSIQRSRPNLIVLDLDTTDFSAFQEVIATLDQSIPVVLLSSRVRLTDKLKSTKQGTTIIQKPFEPEFLKQTISGILTD